MNARKVFLVILLVGVIIIAIGATGHFTLVRNKEVPTTAEQVKIANVSSTTQIISHRNELLNWSTYTNHDFSFEIQYPDSMNLVEDKLENLKKDRSKLYNSDEWYEIAPATFFEKSALGGEFADRLIIDVVNLPLTGGRQKPFTSLDDYIDYHRQLLSKDGNIKNINFTKSSINSLEWVEETYEQVPPPGFGSGKTKLYSLYHNGLIYTFILGSDDPKLLDVYRTIMHTFRFVPFP